MVMGAFCGTSGTSGMVILCRLTVHTDSSTPASDATSPENGPAAITAHPVEISPLLVPTLVSRPPSTHRPVTPQPVTTSAPEDAAKPKVISLGSRNPSPAR